MDIDLNVSVVGRTSGGGPCGTDDVESLPNRLMAEQLPGQFKEKMDVSFNGVSVFALKNLLFPSKNYIDLQCVYVPGDLLILGNFKEDNS
jgi:hypothetical protein